MPDPTQELVDALASACLTARDRGLRYGDILTALRVVDGRVRKAQSASERIHATRQDRTYNASIRPIRSILRDVMQDRSPAQKAG